MGGVSYNTEQGNEIIQYAQRHRITKRRAAELLAEIKGWPRPRHSGRSPRGPLARRR
jgi:hypothetical protein